MNISKKCVGIWNRIKGVGGAYFRALLVILGIAGALFVGHELDVFAAYPLDLSFWAKVTHRGNIDEWVKYEEVFHFLYPISSDETWYSGFSVHTSLSSESAIYGFSKVGGLPAFETLSFDNNYDVLVSDGGKWTTISVDLLQRKYNSSYNDGSNEVEIRFDKCFLGKKPSAYTITIKDKSGTDMTDKFDISGGEILLFGENDDENFYPFYAINDENLTIKLKEDSDLPPLSEKSFAFENDSSGFTYDPSSGKVTLNDKTARDLEFIYTSKYIYFASETNREPWTNDNFLKNYELKFEPESSAFGTISNSDDPNKGAWKLIYNANEIEDGGSKEITFAVTAANEHYEFNKASVQVPGGGTGGITVVNEEGKAPSLSDKNKKLTFSLTIDKSAPDTATVNIGERRYTPYTNTFSYKNSNYKLTDLVSIESVSEVSRELVSDSSKGYYFDNWKIADTRVTLDDNEFSGSYEIEAKSGYYVGDATYSCNNSGYTSILNGEELKVLTSIQNNEIIIDNVKKRYDITFKLDGLREDELQLSEGIWDKQKTITIIKNLVLDGEFKIGIELTNDRKTFISNSAEIEKKIRDANSDQEDLKSLTCARKSDTSIELTIPHSTSERTIIIPSDLLEWKTSDVTFSIDCSFLKGIVLDEYKEKTLNGIKLYKGDVSSSDPDVNNEIELQRNENNGIVTGLASSVTAVPYNEIKYTLVIEGDAYAKLSDAKVDLDADKGGAAVYEEISSTRESKKFTFSLNADCSGAKHRKTVDFEISGIQLDGLSNVLFKLCPKAELYSVESTESGELKFNSDSPIATAPDDSKLEDFIRIDSKNSAQFVVYYPDFNRVFDQNLVTGNSVDVNSRKSTGFNEVFFEVKPSLAGNFESPEVICEEPADAAPTVKFNAVEGVKYYSVIEDEDEDENGNKNTKLGDLIQGTVTISSGQNFSFAAQCSEGYDISTLALKANGEAFSSDSESNLRYELKSDGENGSYYVFTISGVLTTRSITITGDIRVAQLQVGFDKTLENNLGQCRYIYNGASVEGKVTVFYGQGITFEVTLPGECDQSEITVAFYNKNGKQIEVLSRINGRYTLNNITINEGYIRVSGAKLNEYSLTFISNPRATYKNEDGSDLSESTKYIPHGGSFRFRVQPNTGYTMGQNSIVYVRYSDGHAESFQNPSDGIYEIKNLTQSCSISVENVEDIIYTITLVPVDGVTYRNDVDNVIRGTAKVRHGYNFEFSISLSDEYDDSFSGMTIIVNDGKSSQSSVQKIASGRYVIQNVSEDITIKVGNVRRNTYTVILTGAEGIDYYDSSGRVITGDNQVEDHADFSFKVDLYPAYVGSEITVMLGDTPMTRGENGFYTISAITESKTVTVIGIEMNDSSELVNEINNLPDRLDSLSDVDDVIEAFKEYEALSDAEKALIGNIDKLEALQEQVKSFNHISNDVTISGVDWYIKLYAIPITDDTDVCGRIYKKLNSEYILSLYNVYLWNTLTDSRYTLPEGQSVVITLPTPDMTYFENPTAIHEKNSGKIEFINASINNEITTFQADSFSPMGIIANRSSTPGRSSLLDAADANLDAISNFAASIFGNNTNRVTGSNSGDGDNNNLVSDSGEGDDVSGNIDEKFKSRNNKMTSTSSALRLVLVLMILIFISLMIYFFIKRKKSNRDADKE